MAEKVSEKGSIYEFAGFRFESGNQRLWRDSEPIMLPAKSLELLQLLLNRNGEFVLKEEIFEHIWPETFVEDGVLTQNIYTLRKALGKTEDGQQFIENKTRLGYRIIVPVTVTNKNGRPIETEETVNLVQPPPEQTTQRKRRPIVWVVAAIALLAILGAGAIVYRNFRQQIASYFRKPIDQVKFRKLTNTGNVASAAISPDGNSLAYAKNQSVYLKDIASDNEVKLSIEGATLFNSLQFSSDGNSIYFSNNRGFSSTNRVMKVSRLGGVAETILEPVHGGFSVSPDNKFIAFYRAFPPVPIYKLFIRDLKTGEERELAETGIGTGFCYDCAPAWSPDGTKITHISQPLGNFITQQLFVIDVLTGKSEEIKLQKIRRLEQAAWLPDGSALIVSGTDTNRLFHLWKVYYPTGDVQPITSGLSSFSKPLVSKDGKMILAKQTTDQSNIYVAEATDLEKQIQVTSGNSNDFGLGSLIWVGDNSILYSAQTEGTGIEDFWLIGSDGKGRRQITRETFSSPAVPDSDGKHIYFNLIKHGAPNISRLNADGTGQTELTTETTGMRRAAQISPDGEWLYYVQRDRDKGKIVRRNLSNQVVETVYENPEVISPGFYLQLSPDGSHLAVVNWQNLGRFDNERFSTEIAVFPLNNPKDVKFIQIARISPILRFAPDSKGIEFIAAPNGEYQLMRQGFDETEPKPIIKFPNLSLFNFDWSRDGKRIVLSKGESIRDVVLLTEFDK